MNQYTVLLVDDEEEVFQVIMKKLDWESMGFSIAGYARNGVEALEMAEELPTNIYAREFYIDWAMELRGFMERLAREVDDTLVCGKCGGVFRREWGANCPYCRAKENAEKYVNALREAARE